MGITESSTRNNQAPPEKLGEPMADWPEPLKAALKKAQREAYALFPSKLGESATETEREKESEALFCEFMRGGGCKQEFNAHGDCVVEAGSRNTRCQELYTKMNSCMRFHHYYYHSYLAVMSSFAEEVEKNVPALLAARKEAEVRQVLP